MKKTMFVVLSLLLAGTGHATGLTSFDVMFETTDCGGETGFASVAAERIYRIQAADCAQPGDPDTKLKQVLIHSQTSGTAYEVFTVTDEEARSIMRQLKIFRDSKLRALENAGGIIIEK